MKIIFEKMNPTQGYKDLIEYVKHESDPESDIKFINEQFKTFVNYVSAVMDTSFESIYDSKDSRDNYMDDVQSRDKKRRTAHDAAINACAILNRMCDEAGIKRFCPEMPEDIKDVNREMIAEFAFYLTDMFFYQNAGTRNKEKVDFLMGKEVVTANKTNM